MLLGVFLDEDDFFFLPDELFKVLEGLSRPELISAGMAWCK